MWLEAGFVGFLQRRALLCPRREWLGQWVLSVRLAKTVSRINLQLSKEEAENEEDSWQEVCGQQVTTRQKSCEILDVIVSWLLEKRLKLTFQGHL